MRVWNQRNQVPDPVVFADWLGDPEFVSDLWANEAADPDPITRFRYPKSGGGDRLLTVVSTRDHVRLRVAAAKVITITDPLLAKTVYSSRLGKRPPGWLFKTRAYSRFQKAAARDARRWACDGMVRTDVRDFYLTIPIEALMEMIFSAQVDPAAASFLFTQLMRWSDRDRLPGLPVGPDAAGVLGTFYLRPVDRMMSAAFERWHRNTDDIAFFFREARAPDAGIPLMQEAFGELGLDMALGKTKIFDNPTDAEEAIRRSTLDYLLDGVRTGPPGETAGVRAYWDERRANGEFDTVDLSWCLYTLGPEHDPHAVEPVSTERDLFTQHPVACADYLIRTAQADGNAAAGVAAMALDETTHPGVRLHALRYLAEVGVDRSVGLGLLDIARDGTLPIPLRVWAWTAYGMSKAMETSDVGDSVDAERDADVCRAATLAMRRAAGRRGTKYVARHVLRRFPELRPAAKLAVGEMAA